MTKAEAFKLLETAPVGDSPSAINPSFTMTQAVEIVRDGIGALKRDPIPDIFEQRVWQVVKNQRRPRY